MIVSLLSLFVGMGSWGGSQECFNEDCDGVGAFERSAIGRAILTRRTELQGGLAQTLKTREELNAYFRCHIVRGLREMDRRQAESRLREFQTLYQPILELASQHFQMPYALSACLMFRESGFDRNARSSRGAQGIAQFTSETYTRLRNEIANVHQMERGYQDYLQNRSYEDLINYTSMDNMWMRYTQLTQREGILNQQLSPAELKRSRDLARERLTSHARYKNMVDNFDSYLMDVSRYMRRTDNPASVRDRHRQIFPNTPAGQFPSGDDLNPPAQFSSMLQEPAWVIGMNMFYLRQQLLDIDPLLNREGFDPGNDVLSVLVTLGGGYNRGNSDLNNMAGSAPSMTALCTQMASYSETRDYMLSLRRCIARGSFQPPTGPDSTSECADRDQGPPITDPCAYTTEALSTASPAPATAPALMTSPLPRPRPETRSNN